MDYYKITPLIVPANKVSEIRIEPLFKHAEFVPDESRILVRAFPFDGLREDGTYFRSYGRSLFKDPDILHPEWHFDGKAIVLKQYFAGEQEYNIIVAETREGSEEIQRGTRFHLYSLEKDLYERRPFHGNFHIHTTMSDGREEPRYVAARYRQLGMDFCAISDHRRYEPSQIAAEYWKNVNPDFKLYPGEEVHAADNPVHIIHFGGKYSINDLWRDNEEKYRREVAKIQKSLKDIAPGVDSFAVASSEWVFDNIRKAGGLCVFCHPYWFVEQYVIDEGITSEIFKRRKFDAFEVLGGHYRTQEQSNNHQVARWNEERAKGNDFPVVGLDDSHGTDRFLVDNQKVASMRANLAGWYSTLVFAKSDKAEDLIDAIRSGYSAAIDKIEGETTRVYSSFRLVKYGTFLTRWYFPMHDVLCADEAGLMLRILAGDKNAKKALKAIVGSVPQYREDAFRNTAE